MPTSDPSQAFLELALRRAEDIVFDDFALGPERRAARQLDEQIEDADAVAIFNPARARLQGDG